MEILEKKYDGKVCLTSEDAVPKMTINLIALSRQSIWSLTGIPVVLAVAHNVQEEEGWTVFGVLWESQSQRD